MGGTDDDGGIVMGGTDVDGTDVMGGTDDDGGIVIGGTDLAGCIVCFACRQSRETHSSIAFVSRFSLFSSQQSQSVWYGPFAQGSP